MLTSRQALYNLSKNALISGYKQILPAATFVQRNNVSAQLQKSENFSTKQAAKQNLLRFPAFPLEETIERFLKTAQPHLTKEEYEITTEAADDFMRGEGDNLQKLLEKCAKKEENWLAERWLKVGYMRYRDPVTVYSSPGHAFPTMEFADDDDYRQYVGKWIFGLVKYKAMIDNNEIPVHKMGKNELDNSQFGKVLGTIRIPLPIEDKLEYHPESKHVVVIYKNHFYNLPVYNAHGQPLHPNILAKELEKIMESETTKGPEFGLLTTDNRDNWAAARVELLKPDGNRESVSVIEKSLFTVSLDECVTANSNEKMSVNGLQLIHGGGTEQNSANRWMDKTIQLVINRNGMGGFTYEHSPAEGQPIALMCDYVLQNLKNEKHYECAATENYECSTKLRLTMTKCIDQWIMPARRNANNLANNLQLNVLHYKHYGKDFIKKQKLSPDSYIQMAMQYAFFKLHLLPGGHYESAHLRIYTGGRTETIRSCSNESIAFAKAMMDERVTDEQRVEMLRKAVSGHSAYMKMALQGRGVDRHLLGLKLMAIENSLPIPEFFKTPGVIKSSNFRISTSQVASDFSAFMCYGPLTMDGYSVCYNPRPCDMILAMGAWRHNDDSNLEGFVKAMQHALDSMYELLGRAGEKTTSKL